MENETPMQKTGMREYRKGQAKAYFLQHPEASIKEALTTLNGRGVNVSERTVAQARSELAQKGLLPSGRNATAPPPAEPLLVVKDTVIDDPTMKALATGDMSDVLDLDDEEIRKKLLRGVIKIALTPGTHPDTQLSATTVWSKLKDMARVAELGPGKPVDRKTAVARLSDLDTACGLDIAIDALLTAFTPQAVLDALSTRFTSKESTDEGQVSAESSEAASSTAGTAGVPTGDSPQNTDEGTGGA